MGLALLAFDHGRHALTLANGSSESLEQLRLRKAEAKLFDRNSPEP